MNNKEKTPVGCVVLVLIIIAIFFGCFSGGSSSSSSGKKWGDLNEQEKANARWAYYAQQAINERN